MKGIASRINLELKNYSNVLDCAFAERLQDKLSDWILHGENIDECVEGLLSDMAKEGSCTVGKRDAMVFVQGVIEAALFNYVKDNDSVEVLEIIATPRPSTPFLYMVDHDISDGKLVKMRSGIMQNALDALQKNKPMQKIALIFNEDIVQDNENISKCVDGLHRDYADNLVLAEQEGSLWSKHAFTGATVLLRDSKTSEGDSGYFALYIEATQDAVKKPGDKAVLFAGDPEKNKQIYECVKDFVNDKFNYYELNGDQGPAITEYINGWVDAAAELHDPSTHLSDAFSSALHSQEYLSTGVFGV